MEKFEEDKRDKPEYISPSQLGLFLKDPCAYYIKYMCGYKLAFVQTEPMAVGSGFDAYVKSALYTDLNCGSDPAFNLETLYCTQVDKSMQATVRLDSEFLFESYQRCGAYNDLLFDLQRAIETPEFESDLKEVVNGIPLAGKPDIFFWVKDSSGARHPVILDFKVNGYYSAYLKSPDPGYIRVRGHKPKGPHPKCKLESFCGMYYNSIGRLATDWEQQMTFYAWLKGAPVGEPIYMGIEQLCNKELRVAQHRYLGTNGLETWKQVEDLWKRVNAGTAFFEGHPILESRGVSSEELCEQLSYQVAGIKSDLDGQTSGGRF